MDTKRRREITAPHSESVQIVTVISETKVFVRESGRERERERGRGSRKGRDSESGRETTDNRRSRVYAVIEFISERSSVSSEDVTK